MMSTFFKKLRHRKMPALPNREGFTLVEILVVLFILSVGVLPLVLIQHQARRDVTQSDHYTQALMVAQENLERIKGLGFGTAAADSGQVGSIAWRATVTNESFGLDRIELTAAWPSGGQVQTLTIADCVSMR